MNTKKYWFAQKRFGYGLIPISWEGWLMTLVLIGLILASAYEHGFMEEVVDTRNGVGYILDVIMLVILFGLVSIHKMKGEMKWRWGTCDEDACSLKQQQ